MDLGYRRVVFAVVAIVLVVGGAVAYVTSVVRDTSPAAVSPVDGDLMFVALADGRGRVEQVRLAEPAARSATPMTCQRVYRAGGTTVCLKLAGPGPTYAAEVSRDGEVVRTVPLPACRAGPRCPPRGGWSRGRRS